MPPLSMLTTLWNVAYSAGTGFFTNRLSTSAAAMAFYTMFAIGPIMIFSIAVAEPRLLRPSEKTTTPWTMFALSRLTTATSESGTLVPFRIDST